MVLVQTDILPAVHPNILLAGPGTDQYTAVYPNILLVGPGTDQYTARGDQGGFRPSRQSDSGLCSLVWFWHAERYY